MKQKPDGIIFDMDGTLWDALDTYVASWNAGFRKEGVDKVVGRRDLDYMMGWEKKNVLEHVLPDYDASRQEEIFNTINRLRSGFIRQLGGRLYEGVREGLRSLSLNYKLFIVSNSPPNLIGEFMDWANIRNLIADEIAHGDNFKPKDYNIRLLVEKHRLKFPVYIGDTEIDSRASRKAGVPFVFMSYGFGKTEDFDIKFDSFNELTDFFNGLK